ncbi:F0F1-type ATP synthase assembly protein I [Cellulomonas soli]|nr:F0F1-type ATP synthase assembly protein I [Cellulomonas soli]
MTVLKPWHLVVLLILVAIVAGVVWFVRAVTKR